MTALVILRWKITGFFMSNSNQPKSKDLLKGLAGYCQRFKKESSGKVVIHTAESNSVLIF